MKGVILAGGNGTRLLPMTLVTNKHLLPVYNLPMIFYPISVLKAAGIEEIMIITGKESAGDFLNLLNDGSLFNLSLTYRVQMQAGGIAEALGLCEQFAAGENICVILGDNIFVDNNISERIADFGENSTDCGAKIFLKQVPDAKRFGVPAILGDKITRIDEKPDKPASDYAVTGLYLYDNTVFNKIKQLSPSRRGELEITDVNNAYIADDKMRFEVVDGFWSDAGTVDSLFKASQFIRGGLGE